MKTTLEALPENHPLAVVIRKAAAVLKLSRIPACSIQISSTIPIAGGMGSGAAVSAAVLRAFSASVGHPLSDQQVSDLVYEAERIYHGDPSGIDNTVVTYARPVYFVKGNPIEILKVKQSLHPGHRRYRDPQPNRSCRERVFTRPGKAALSSSSSCSMQLERLRFLPAKPSNQAILKCLDP